MITYRSLFSFLAGGLFLTGLVMLFVVHASRHVDGSTGAARACNAVISMHNWRTCRVTAEPGATDCWHVAGQTFGGVYATARVCCTDVRCDAHGD